MDTEYRQWVDRWLDHLLVAYDDDNETILAEHARALELDDPGELPSSVITLFRIDLEGTRSDPEWANRMLQASYAATFRVIRELTAHAEMSMGDSIPQGMPVPDTKIPRGMK